MIVLIVILALILLIIGTYTDIKTREVPDWVNYSAIFSGFGVRLIWSSVEWSYIYILDGIIGFSLFFVIAYFLYRSGQWGGGDAKTLMALGVIIGFPLAWDNFAIALLVNIAIVGGIYGLIWSLVLAFTNWQKTKKEFLKLLHHYRSLRMIPLVLLIAIVLASFIIAFDPVLFTFFVILLLLIPLFFYLTLLIRAVEKVCMQKLIPIKELTEGDWIIKDVKVNNKLICSKKDLGATKKQISLLKRLKVKNVLIKIGIPFVPSFLLAFILTLLIHNPLFLLV